MVRYSNAVFFLISTSALLYADSFQSLSLPGNAMLSKNTSPDKAISASVYSSYDGNKKRISEELKESMQKLTFSSPFEDVDDDDFDNYSTSPKDLSRLSANSYTIELPLSSTLETPLGLSLRQVGKGTQISDLALNLDSLNLVTPRDISEKAVSKENEKIENEFQIYTLDDTTLVNLFENNFGPNFEGVIVSEVMENGLAWEAGVRIGDVLVATSATMGDKIWPKATLEGVRSAFTSRKVMSSI